MIGAWRRIAVLLVAGLLVLLFSAYYPFRQLRAERASRERARVVLVEKERERAELERRAALLSRPEEVERLARERFGLARPDEIAYVVVPDN